MQYAFPAMAASILLYSAALRAQEPAQVGPPESAPTAHESSNRDLSSDNDSGWVRGWMRVAEKARSSQPHFVAPLVTTHVMLVQQFRYDMSWQEDPSGTTITSNYGSSRGLEIIPSNRLELGISPPSFIVHGASFADGFGDLLYQVKFRAFSAPEGKGDYFVGFFFGGTIPTGSVPNGLGHAVLSPTFAAAKGVGPWDIQSTIGATLPINAPTFWVGRSSSTRLLPTGSKEGFGPWSNRIRHSGWTARWTEKSKSF
jgi:hypothetical protein